MEKTISERVPHIWIINFDVPSEKMANLEGVLSEDELERAFRFKFDKDRTAYIIARGSLRYLISIYTDIDPANIQFKYSNYGKPELAYPDIRLEFNVSHSNEMGLLGFSAGVPIGVDIECIKYSSDLKQVAKRFFSSHEVNEFLSLPDSDRPHGFFNCWTRKESFIKAIGHGLSFPLDQFDVSLTPGQKPRLLATHFNPSEVHRWSLRSIDVPKGYAAAFALPVQIMDFELNELPIDFI